MHCRCYSSTSIPQNVKFSFRFLAKVIQKCLCLSRFVPRPVLSMLWNIINGSSGANRKPTKITLVVYKLVWSKNNTHCRDKKYLGKSPGCNEISQKLKLELKV